MFQTLHILFDTFTSVIVPTFMEWKQTAETWNKATLESTL